MKKIHIYRPHIFNHSNGAKIHRITLCAVENKTCAYKSTVHSIKATCERCIAKAFPKTRGK
jgi:hypothetical protein